MKPKFFSTPEKFRDWLRKNHSKKKELIVGFYKKDSGKKSITWPESVDQALCFGWIDGIRRSLDETSYSIRFTPRNPGSNWSEVNVRKIKELREKNLLEPAGEKVFNEWSGSKTQYSYEKKPEKFSSEFEYEFRKNKAAWKWFSSMTPSYKKTATHWVMSAKREETRKKRILELINDSENKRKIKPLNY